MSLEQLQVEEIKEKISKEIENKFLKAQSPITLEDLKDKCTELLKRYTNNDSESRVGNMTFLWKRMSLKEKFLWWFLKTFFPADQKGIYDDLILLHHLYKNQEVVEIEYILSIPSYLQPDPKSIMIMDVYFRPPVPSETIVVNFGRIDK